MILAQRREKRERNERRCFRNYTCNARNARPCVELRKSSVPTQLERNEDARQV